jgi:hypothetical protein
MLVLLLMPGCAAKKPAPAATRPAADLSELFRARRIVPQPPAATLLVDGNLPLVYQFGLGGPVKLYDATDRSQIWSATVPPDSILLVNTTGVLVKGVRALPRPLDPRHRYELWYEP